MGAVGRLIKLGYHCEPIDIRSTCFPLQQKKKNEIKMIILYNCGSMITGGDRWRALQVWSGTRSVLVLIQHGISLLHVSDMHGEEKWGVGPCCCPWFSLQASNLLLGGAYELVMIRMLLLFGPKADELWQQIQISLQQLPQVEAAGMIVENSTCQQNCESIQPEKSHPVPSGLSTEPLLWSTWMCTA